MLKDALLQTELRLWQEKGSLPPCSSTKTACALQNQNWTTGFPSLFISPKNYVLSTPYFRYFCPRAPLLPVIFRSCSYSQTPIAEHQVFAVKVESVMEWFWRKVKEFSCVFINKIIHIVHQDAMHKLLAKLEEYKCVLLVFSTYESQNSIILFLKPSYLFLAVLMHF